VINVHWVHEVSLVKVETATGKLKTYKSPGTDKIPAELIKAEGEILRSEIYRLICSVWNKEESPQQWKESITLPIYKRVIRLIVIIIEESPSYRTVHQLFIDFKKPCDSIKTEILHNIPLEFYIPKKLVRLIKMCLNETYSKVRVYKYLCGTFPIQNGPGKRDALSPFLFNFALEYAIRKA
jgi:hypothetical protein